MFMNAIGQQMAIARGASARPPARRWRRPANRGLRGPGPLSAWVSALGGLGSVLGDSNASTLTYNFGGAAAGSTIASTRASWSASAPATRTAHSG